MGRLHVCARRRLRSHLSLNLTSPARTSVAGGYREQLTHPRAELMAPVALITADVIERYRRDGVVLLRQALHPTGSHSSISGCNA